MYSLYDMCKMDKKKLEKMIFMLDHKIDPNNDTNFNEQDND